MTWSDLGVALAIFVFCVGCYLWGFFSGMRYCAKRLEEELSPLAGKVREIVKMMKK